jgi:hypothetical protein
MSASKNLQLITLPLVLQESILPRRAGPKSVHRSYGRGDNRVSITVSGGYFKGEQLCVPASVLGRRLFYWMVSEVRRTGNPVVEFSGCPEMFETLGLTLTSKQRRRLKNEILRIAYMNITIEAFPNKKEMLVLPNVSVFKFIHLHDLLIPKQQLPLFKSRLEFTEAFTESILSLKHQPIDASVINKLTSPLAIDIYLWLARRVQTVNYRQEFNFGLMKQQFGKPGERTAEFKKLFIPAFKSAAKHIKIFDRPPALSKNGVVLYLSPQQVDSKAQPGGGWG